MYICQTLVQIWRFLYKFWITVLFSANTWQLVRLSFIYLRIRYENPYDIDETLICRLVSSFIKFQKNEGYVFCDGKKLKLIFRLKNGGFKLKFKLKMAENYQKRPNNQSCKKTWVVQSVFMYLNPCSASIILVGTYLIVFYRQFPAALCFGLSVTFVQLGRLVYCPC